MSDYDLLLEWVSEKGSGSWREFKDAWDWISSRKQESRGDDPAGKAWIAAAKLTALAHVEISWKEGGSWAVAPAVVTMLPNSGGRALLTGSRTRTLYRPGTQEDPEQRGLLPDAIRDADLDIFIDDLPMQHGPTSVFLACSAPEDAEALARHCGIAYSYSVSAQLARMLPPLAAYRALWRPRAVPEGHPVERFDVADLTWKEATDRETSNPGLYRCRLWDGHVHVLRDALGNTLGVSREEAVYEVLRWEARDVLGYDAAAHLLWVPSHARLPLIHERAAVLCSGRLPRYRKSPHGSPGVTYVNVQPDLARLIAESLDQSLEEMCLTH